MSERIKSNKIRINDISISYFIKKSSQSDAQTVIFLHGFPFNKNMWRNQLSALDDTTTGIAIDVRGHGNTTSGHGFFSVDVFAKDLLAFVRKLDLGRVILCGISMGGYIALRSYELAPDLIAGLILCDTHSKADDNVAKQKRFDSIQAVLSHGRRPFAIGFIENVFANPRAQENEEAVELIKSSIRRNSLSSICSTLLALASRTETTQVLPNIQIPTLLIRGEEDKLTSEELMRTMHEKIAHSTFTQIPASGHLPNLENESAFNQAMKDYLQRIPAQVKV